MKTLSTLIACLFVVNTANAEDKWEYITMVFKEYTSIDFKLFQSREFEEALTLAGEMLKLEPENKTLQAYLKVLDEHKDLAEEEEDDDDDDDDDEEEEDDDEEEEEEEADYAHNDNLRGGHEKKKTHK